jgi:hypothetical protein
VKPQPDRILWDQYRVVIDEYRFQVDLNWRRSQYYFVLSAALLAAALGLFASNIPLPRLVVALPFGLGLFVITMAVAANSTQKDYYHAIREKKRLIEMQLGMGDLAIQTTRGMGNRRIHRIGRVTTFQVAVLLILAVANTAGIAVALLVARDTTSTPTISMLNCRLSESHRQIPGSVTCRLAKS